jgi:hypothetical protein
MYDTMAAMRILLLSSSRFLVLLQLSKKFRYMCFFENSDNFVTMIFSAYFCVVVAATLQRRKKRKEVEETLAQVPEPSEYDA